MPANKGPRHAGRYACLACGSAVVVRPSRTAVIPRPRPEPAPPGDGAA